MKETDRNERLRRVRASQSTARYIEDLKISPTVDKVNQVLDDADLSKQEKQALINKAGNRQESELRISLSGFRGRRRTLDVSMETTEQQYQDLESLLDSPLLTFEQKKVVLEKIRKSFTSKLNGFDGSDGLDILFESILFTEDEKNSVLFNLDQIRNGKFEISEVELESFIKILKERSFKDEANKEG